MIRNLSKQIIYQNDAITKLRRRLAIIGDVASEGGNIASRRRMKSESIRNDTKVNIKNGNECMVIDMVDNPCSDLKCKKSSLWLD